MAEQGGGREKCPSCFRKKPNSSIFCIDLHLFPIALQPSLSSPRAGFLVSYSFKYDCVLATMNCIFPFIFLVIKAKVLDTNWQPQVQQGKSVPSYYKPRYIKVQLRRLFKGSKVVNAKKYATVYIRFASLDRPLLEVGHVYVLSGYSFGTSLYMNTCSWNAKWSDLTTGQRFGITRFFYWIYCRCSIDDCQTKSCLSDLRSCTWDRRNTKQADFLINDGICMVTDGSRCKWKNFSL